MRFKHSYAIAIAVPKNATESIHEALAYVFPNGLQNRIHNHDPLFLILNEGREDLHKYFIFATVREPVDRFVSAWWYLQLNTGPFERMEWNPEMERRGTHIYLNNIEDTISLLERLIIPDCDSTNVRQYFHQISPLDYVFHPQWVYCVDDMDGLVPDWLNIYNIPELVKQWPELTKKYFTWGNWQSLPLSKLNSTPPEFKKSIEETLSPEQIQRIRAIYEKDYRLFSKYF